MPIESKEVQLKDRTVTIRELTGADEILAVKLLAGQMDNKDKEANEIQNFNIMFGLSIWKVNGEPLNTPSDFEELMGRLARFKLKELGKLKAAFVELNTPEGDFLEEQTN